MFDKYKVTDVVKGTGTIDWIDIDGAFDKNDFECPNCNCKESYLQIYETYDNHVCYNCNFFVSAYYTKEGFIQEEADKLNLETKPETDNPLYSVCPKCGSLTAVPLTGTRKVGEILFGGIYMLFRNLDKNMICKYCGHRWLQ